LSERSRTVKGRKQELFLLIFSILFCTCFLGLGLAALSSPLRFYTWTKVPCVIEKFEIRDNSRAEKPFSPILVYRYEWQGHSVIGTQLRADNEDDARDYVELADLREAMLKGGGQVQGYCRVNGSQPGGAALLPGVVHAGAVMFVAFGLGMSTILFAVFRFRLRGIDPSKSMSARILVPFCLMFTTVGVVLVWEMGPELLRYFQALHWKASTATAVWSRVGEQRVSSRNGTRTIYYPDIFYRYEYGGTEYHNNGYGPFSQTSTGYSESARVAKSHLAGSALTCYVNPDKPWQAVLEQSFEWRSLAILMALPFLFFGLRGLFWITGTRGRIRNLRSKPPWRV
jgi:hypothetical protein